MHVKAPQGGRTLISLLVVGWVPVLTVRPPPCCGRHCRHPDGWEVEGVLQQGRLYPQKSNCSRPFSLQGNDLWPQSGQAPSDLFPLKTSWTRTNPLIAAARLQLAQTSSSSLHACRASCSLFFSLFFSSDLRFFPSLAAFFFSFLSQLVKSLLILSQDAGAIFLPPGSRAWRSLRVGLHSFGSDVENLEEMKLFGFWGVCRGLGVLLQDLLAAEAKKVVTSYLFQMVQAEVGQAPIKMVSRVRQEFVANHHHHQEGLLCDFCPSKRIIWKDVAVDGKDASSAKPHW
ncbi:hypothetical protein GWK47_039699 [Chionoecetes opilio]|uniref:Uncharacterized protein n=1 Tax=Chionoecetes opilio TaxID=41210 RepID=A0A8J4YBB7_CHIOP|nr:hypothetical protein GWK47_039699 [Chionoecetes opilio]